jgi:hypothetical protein
MNDAALNDYAPSAELLAIGAPLNAAEAAQTLLRFPGPCGLTELARGQMRRLAPENAKFLYLFKNRYDYFQAGIEAFGTLAVFNPTHYHSVLLTDAEALTLLGFTPQDTGRIFLGLNLAAPAAEYFWMPPELFAARNDWTGIRDTAAMLREFGHGYDARRKELTDNVLRYMEEVSAVERAGTTLTQPWYRYDAEQRRRLIGERSLSVRWTR